MDMIKGSHNTGGNNWVGLLVPPVLVLYGIIFPKIGGFLGRADRRFILEQVQIALAARVEESNLTV